MAFLNDVTVWLLDSSSLIRTKLIINLREQWSAFRVLEDMAKNGQIAMPKQVINEVSRVRHPDIPGAWVVGVENYLEHPVNVDHRILSIIKSQCPDLADPRKEIDDADPYVVALAYQLQEQKEIPCIETDQSPLFNESEISGQKQKEIPCIVTEDKVDRIVTEGQVDRKIQSIVSACKQLKLKYTYTRDFLTHLNIPTKNKTDKE